MEGAMEIIQGLMALVAPQSGVAVTETVAGSVLRVVDAIGSEAGEQLN